MIFTCKPCKICKTAFPATSIPLMLLMKLPWNTSEEGRNIIRLRSDTNRWDIKTAKEICEKTISSYPGSNGAQNCSILLKEIMNQSLTFTLNYANVPDLPFLGS